MTGTFALDVCIAIGIIGGAITLLWRGVIFVMGIYRRVQNFLDDWNGELPRPGIPARPGFPERIASIEAELKTNHGSSLRDAVNRMEKHLSEHVKISEDE